MQTITTLAELDEKIAECDRAAKTSDRALRDVFASFQMSVTEPLPSDPLGREYAAAQFELYRKLAGKPYRVENETTPFDIDEATRCPFPYSTNDPRTTADQFTAIGALLRRLDLPPGGRIIEFGPGWGNTTIALALLGFQVTAVDIEPRFCQLLQRRAALHGVRIDVVNADFLWIESARRQFDAAIFFECFHHAANHRRLLRALHGAIAPAGKVLFGAEPICPEFPIPWGLRLDGQSLWSIRKHGWLELGFNESYFVDVLANEGWLATKHASSESRMAEVWEASKAETMPLSFPATDQRIVVPSNMRSNHGIQLQELADDWAFFGPYATLPAGHWLARIHFQPTAKPCGTATVDVCTDQGQRIFNSREIDISTLKPSQSVLQLDFHLPQVTNLVETRMFCHTPCTIGVDAIEFVYQA